MTSPTHKKKKNKNEVISYTYAMQHLNGVVREAITKIKSKTSNVYLIWMLSRYRNPRRILLFIILLFSNSKFVWGMRRGFDRMCLQKSSVRWPISIVEWARVMTHQSPPVVTLMLQLVVFFSFYSSATFSLMICYSMEWGWKAFESNSIVNTAFQIILEIDWHNVMLASYLDECLCWAGYVCVGVIFDK